MTRKEIIGHMKAMADHAARMTQFRPESSALYVMTVKDLDVVKEAAELLTARPAIHIHKEYPEHEWKRKENGEIDDCAFDTDNHNGPVCVRCWDSFCIWCEPNGFETHKRCFVDWYECPECGGKVPQRQEHCAHCGKGIVWE